MAFDGCRWYRLYMYLVLVGLLAQLECASAARCLTDRPGTNSSSVTVLLFYHKLQQSTMICWAMLVRFHRTDVLYGQHKGR